VGKAPDPLDALDARAPRCPQCGFVVFSRLNPCCERCGTRLPESMVPSAEHRAAYQRQLQLDAARLVRAREVTSGPPADPDAVRAGLEAFEQARDIVETTADLIRIAGEVLR
jgi:hypothetical protein